MKGNRDMFYGNYQMGAQMDPNVFVTPSSGYNINSNYMSYGPNVVPPMGIPNNNMQMGNNLYGGTVNDDYDNRITRLEKQIKKLDARIKRLENNSNILDDDTIVDSNLYMI